MDERYPSEVVDVAARPSRAAFGIVAEFCCMRFILRNPFCNHTRFAVHREDVAGLGQVSESSRGHPGIQAVRSTVAGDYRPCRNDAPRAYRDSGKDNRASADPTAITYVHRFGDVVDPPASMVTDVMGSGEQHGSRANVDTSADRHRVVDEHSVIEVALRANRHSTSAESNALGDS